MGAAWTMAYLHYQTGESPQCPCCQREPETSRHITQCQEAGRHEALSASIQCLADWMSMDHTDPLVHRAVIAFFQYRGVCRWSKITAEFPGRYQALCLAQEELRWDSLLAGMVSKEFQSLQADQLAVSTSQISLCQWMTKFITQLLQILRGQWLYRNKVVHNATSRTWHYGKKQQLQERIDAEFQCRLEHLQPEDYHLMLAPLEDISTAKGKHCEYWLLEVDRLGGLGNCKSSQPQALVRLCTGEALVFGLFPGLWSGRGDLSPMQFQLQH